MVMIVIGDIAGQHSALMKLIDKVPPLKPIVLLGDLNDRGWESKQVIAWAIANENRVTTLDSNHGDMFVDWFFQTMNGFTSSAYQPRYDNEVFEYNGGRATLSSYGINISRCDADELLANKTLCDHVAWLRTRPSSLLAEIAGQKYFFSHAPMNPNTHRDLKQFLLRGKGYCVDYGYAGDQDSTNNFQWNRNEPFQFHRDLPDTISVFGHNSGKDLKLFCEQYKDGIYVKGTDYLQALVDKNKGEVYGICMDTSKDEKLTALDLDTMTIYHSNYAPKNAGMY